MEHKQLFEILKKHLVIDTKKEYGSPLIEIKLIWREEAHSSFDPVEHLITSTFIKIPNHGQENIIK